MTEHAHSSGAPALPSKVLPILCSMICPWTSSVAVVILVLFVYFALFSGIIDSNFVFDSFRYLFLIFVVCYRKMHHVVKFAADTEKFLQHTDVLRDEQKDVLESNSTRDLPPVFNKRLFASQGTVVLTSEARRIMEKNIRNRESSRFPYLSKKELMAMRSVVDGLKLIHNGQDYIKDVISHAITLETYTAFEYIVKRVWEECLSCYYIIHGAVEVTYDMRATESRNVYQPNIIYSHSSGEYIGLVNAEGRTEDLAPPATVYTKEVCHLLKIDRSRFHRMITQITSVLNIEKHAFLKSGGTILSTISRDAKDKILSKLEKKVCFL